MFGYRRVYQCGLVVFTLTSLFCALSDSLHTLTLARIAQGFGGAALMSVNTALIRLIYPHRHLGRGMGINSFIVAVSSAAGPTIAAAILSVASWQWLFAINVPLGIVAIFFALRYLPENGPKNTMPRFDLPSAVMNALTFNLLITALSGFAQGQSLSLIAAEIVALLIIGFSLYDASWRCPCRYCRSICCVFRCFRYQFVPPFARSAPRCWRWLRCHSFCRACLAVRKWKQACCSHHGLWQPW